jgi:hypothetical protein
MIETTATPKPEKTTSTKVETTVAAKLETTTAPKTPTLVDPAGEPVAPAEPTLATRRAELVDVVTKRAQRVAATTRTRIESARNTAVARVQELRKAAGDALANTTREGVPARVRNVVHDQLERAATALHAAAKRIEPRA